jgi:putative ABC transport system permease protein
VRLAAVDAGFDATNVLTFRTSLPPVRYPDSASMVRAYVELGRRLRDAPGVRAAGAVTGLPLATTRGDWGVTLEGDTSPSRISRAADWQVVTPGYFEAMGTPLKAGRTFTAADRADTLPVIVVNESMAKRFWPNQSPLGRRLTMGGNNRWLTVVGVVGDVHHRGLDAAPRTEMYRPHSQFRYGDATAPAVPTLTWVVRTSADPRAAISYARAAVRDVDPNLGLSDVATMEEVVADSTSDRRLSLWLFALLGGLALALAAVGVYGVVSYSVAQRTHEIGVRMAIGATSVDVARMIVADGGKLALVGVAAGSLLAAVAARLIRGLLFDVSAADPATFVAAPLVLLAIAVLASYIPARRASRIAPAETIRT